MSRVMMSVDPEFRELVKSVKKDVKISDREVTRILTKNIKESMLKQEKKAKKEKGGFFDF